MLLSTNHSFGYSCGTRPFGSFNTYNADKLSPSPRPAPSGWCYDSQPSEPQLILSHLFDLSPVILVPKWPARIEWDTEEIPQNQLGFIMNWLCMVPVWRTWIQLGAWGGEKKKPTHNHPHLVTFLDLFHRLKTIWLGKRQLAARHNSTTGKDFCKCLITTGWRLNCPY